MLEGIVDGDAFARVQGEDLIKEVLELRYLHHLLLGQPLVAH